MSVADMWKQFYYLVLGVAIFSFLSLISCGGGGGGSESEQQSPRILVTTKIDFGDVFLDTISEQGVTIRNVGSSPLTIGQIAQTDFLDTPFSILNDKCSETGLNADQECTFNVRFFPNSQGTGQGKVIDHFDIPTNDPNFQSVTVSVTGNAEGIRVSIIQVIATQFPIVELTVAVSDKDGAVTDLLPNNFTLFENENIDPETIELTPLSSVTPISVAMTLDFSDTMAPYYDNIVSSSKGFVGLLNPSDNAAIIKFAKTIEVKQSFTNNIDYLLSAIDNPYTGLGTDLVKGTFLYDALMDAIDITALQLNHRSIIVISDGKDENPPALGQGSVATMEQVINYANANNVSIYTIGLGVDVNTTVMGQLANQTGGQFFRDPNSAQLIGIYNVIRDILNGQYKITYSSLYPTCVPITDNVVVNTGIYQDDAVKQVQGCP